MSEDVPQDDEDDDAHAATASSQLSSAVACGNSTQQLAHRFSGTKVRVAHGESHDSYRGVPAPVTQNYIATAGGQVAQLVEQRTENPRVGSSILPLAIPTQ